LLVPSPSCCSQGGGRDVLGFKQGGNCSLWEVIFKNGVHQRTELRKEFQKTKTQTKGEDPSSLEKDGKEGETPVESLLHSEEATKTFSMKMRDSSLPLI